MALKHVHTDFSIESVNKFAGMCRRGIASKNEQLNDLKKRRQELQCKLQKSIAELTSTNDDLQNITAKINVQKLKAKNDENILNAMKAEADQMKQKIKQLDEEIDLEDDNLFLDLEEYEAEVDDMAMGFRNARLINITENLVFEKDNFSSQLETVSKQKEEYQNAIAHLHLRITEIKQELAENCDLKWILEIFEEENKLVKEQLEILKSKNLQ